MAGRPGQEPRSDHHWEHFRQWPQQPVTSTIVKVREPDACSLSHLRRHGRLLPRPESHRPRARRCPRRSCHLTP
eukprot:5476998-Amphidinium_carterae.1